MALHRVQKPTDRMSLRRRCIVGAVDRQHRGVPGERQQEKKQRTAEREAALPKLAPAPRHREVRHRGQQRHHHADRSFGQGRERHPEVEEPEKMAPPAFRACGEPRRTMQPQPKAEQRQGGEKDQHAVGQSHAPDRDHLDIEQQHQPAEQAQERAAHASQEQVLEQDEGHAEQRGGQAGGEFAHAEQAVGQAHQPVQKDRLRVAGFVVEGRAYPVAGFEHLAPGFGVPALVPISQAQRPEPEEQQQDREREQNGEVGCMGPRQTARYPPFAIGCLRWISTRFLR